MENLPDELVIEVTREDIDQGIPAKESSCAIAKAIKRTMPNAYGIGVGKKQIVISDKVYETPACAANFIRKFDGNVGGELCTLPLAMAEQMEKNKQLPPFTFKIVRQEMP